MRRATAIVLLLLVAGCSTADGTSSPSASRLPEPSPVDDRLALTAGWWTFPDFDWPFAFQVHDEGWQAGHLAAEFSDIFRGDPAGAYTTVSLAHPARFHRTESDAEPATTPEVAVSALQSNDELHVSDAIPVAVFGTDALRVDVSVRTDAEARAIWSGLAGTLRLIPGRTLRLTIVPHGGELLMLGIEAPTETFAEEVEAAQPILDSLVELPSDG